MKGLRRLPAATAVASAILVSALVCAWRRSTSGLRERERDRRFVPRDECAAALVAAALISSSLPVLRREAARQRDRDLFWTFVAAEHVKLSGAFAWYYVIERLYPGGADAVDYDRAGRAIADRLRSGKLAGVKTLARTVPWDTQRSAVVGTNFVRVVGGVIYAVIGRSKLGAFVVFSWVAFWGLFLFYRAFALAVPAGCVRTYARLVFFLPSLVFWTSTIGKEAWMVFSLGTTAFGVAHTMSGSPRRGVCFTALGGALTVLVRPHVPAMLGRSFASRLGEDRARTAVGESRFSPRELRSARDFPLVAASVLFRPHPLEAHNAAARVAAVEGAFLVLLSLRRIRWFGAAVSSIPRQPYVGFSALSLAALIAALARLANFGLLVRERAPIMPFYLVLASIPPRRR